MGFEAAGVVAADALATDAAVTVGTDVAVGAAADAAVGAAAADVAGGAIAADAAGGALAGGALDAGAAYGFGGAADLGGLGALGTGFAGGAADLGAAGLGTLGSAYASLPSAITGATGAGGFGMSSIPGLVKPLGSLAQAAGGVAGGNKVAQGAKEGASAADPFAQYRPAYGKQLNTLMSDPSSITSMPGYQAGLTAVERAGASQGYTGSGFMAGALANYGGQQYQQALNNLMILSGATTGSPASAGQILQQGATNQAQIQGQAVNSALYGAGQLSDYFSSKPTAPTQVNTAANLATSETAAPAPTYDYGYSSLGSGFYGMGDTPSYF